MTAACARADNWLCPQGSPPATLKDKEPGAFRGGSPFPFFPVVGRRSSVSAAAAERRCLGLLGLMMIDALAPPSHPLKSRGCSSRPKRVPKWPKAWWGWMDRGGVWRSSIEERRACGGSDDSCRSRPGSSRCMGLTSHTKQSTSTSDSDQPAHFPTTTRTGSQAHGGKAARSGDGGQIARGTHCLSIGARRWRGAAVIAAGVISSEAAAAQHHTAPSPQWQWRPLPGGSTGPSKTPYRVSKVLPRRSLAGGRDRDAWWWRPWCHRTGLRRRWRCGGDRWRRKEQQRKPQPLVSSASTGQHQTAAVVSRAPVACGW